MSNPKAGHTSATGMGTSSEGLRDGDGVSSPSLTGGLRTSNLVSVILNAVVGYI